MTQPALPARAIHPALDAATPEVAGLGGFHSAVRTWFEQALGAPSKPQALAWPAIRRGAHTLIAAPTGSGKTLAAFLAALDELVRDDRAGALGDEVRVVYV